MNLYLIASATDFSLTDTQRRVLESAGNLKVIIHTGRLSDIGALLEDAEEKVIGIDPDVVGWNLDFEDLGKIKNIKAICTQSTSFGWLQPEELQKMGIRACCVPSYSSDSVAEYVFALALETARRLPLHLKNMSLDWKTRPLQLKGKILGVIGLGSIGTHIAEIGQGFGMEVRYWSRKSRDARFVYCELDELFSHADVLIPSLKDSEETKLLITHERIDALKPTAIVVGIGKVKELFDEPYVISRVEQGLLGGYGFEGDNAKDVHSTANVWGVPPIAWYTTDSLTNLVEGWVHSVIDAAKM